MTRIAVLLADDHTLVREGLRALLLSETDIEIVGEARNGREAVRCCEEMRPDIVLMDVGMPRLNGLEAARQILAKGPRPRIILLSAHADDEYVAQALEIGASGYLVKHASYKDLARAIREVHAGRQFLSPALARRLEARLAREGPRRRPRGTRGLATLTPREVEVLQLVAEGAGNKQVAAELGISVKTVDKHRQSVMTKLDIHDVAGLTRFAIASGVIDGGVQVIIT